MVRRIPKEEIGVERFVRAYHLLRSQDGFRRISRNNVNMPLRARAIMVALRGVGNRARLPPRKVEALLSELAAQKEHWITAENTPQ